MDAPMDIGTSSHQLPPPLHQTFNTQHPSTNANTGGYWPASPARICLHGCLGCASSDRNGPPLRTNADSCGRCPPRPRSLPRHPSQGPHKKAREGHLGLHGPWHCLSGNLGPVLSSWCANVPLLRSAARVSDMPDASSCPRCFIFQDSDRLRRGASTPFALACPLTILSPSRALLSRPNDAGTSS